MFQFIFTELWGVSVRTAYSLGDVLVVNRKTFCVKIGELECEDLVVWTLLTTFLIKFLGRVLEKNGEGCVLCVSLHTFYANKWKVELTRDRM